VDKVYDKDRGAAGRINGSDLARKLLTSHRKKTNHDPFRRSPRKDEGLVVIKTLLIGPAGERKNFATPHVFIGQFKKAGSQCRLFNYKIGL
jgi:hypothetical protein